jgi:hypothetical protein
VFENRALGAVLGPKGDKQPFVFRIAYEGDETKEKNMSGPCARRERISNGYKISVGKSEGKITLGRSRLTKEDFG